MKKNDSSQLPQELYAKHEKVYPREVHGLFAKLRLIGVFALLGPYYLLPWITWGGRQSILFDLPGRKFHVFGLTFWPQDFFYLAVLLIIAALALFFFTSLAGRLWCGYACPQTVWTEVFLWIERKVEGGRPKQIKLDKAPMSAHKFKVKAIKHTLWILLSLWTGLTFVGFFTPIRELSLSVLSLSMGPWEAFWIVFYGFATYGNAGFLREQVCIYMCPYARFQSAMFDNNTLVISYDDQRGEPRGSRRKSANPTELGLGDCVDCNLCVQVCPTGIDIRDGLQYQCIGCAACIDVCETVMDKMGYDKALIRYTTENAIKGNPSKILRPRTVLYAATILILFASMMVSILSRIPLELDIIRDRNALYRENVEGMIENIYTLKVINMDEKSHRYSLSISGLEGAKLVAKPVTVDSGEIKDLVVKIVIDPVYISRISSDVEFQIQALDDPTINQEEAAKFLGPVWK